MKRESFFLTLPKAGETFELEGNKFTVKNVKHMKINHEFHAICDFFNPELQITIALKSHKPFTQEN